MIKYKDTCIAAAIFLSACAGSPTAQGLHAPIKSLHAAEIPFLVDVCHAHLFQQSNTTDMLVRNGYENKPYPIGPSGFPYSKSSTNLTLHAYAAIGMESATSCKIQTYSNAGGGPIRSHLMQKLAKMGYNPVGQEKYGALNTQTLAILSNGTNAIGFTGRKQTQNAATTNTIIFLRR